MCLVIFMDICLGHLQLLPVGFIVSFKYLLFLMTAHSSFSESISQVDFCACFYLYFISQSSVFQAKLLKLSYMVYVYRKQKRCP